MSRRAFRITAVGAVALLIASTAHSADAATTGDYGTFTAAGSTGAVATDAAGYPAGTITSTSNTLAAESGATSFLGPATPFGAVFGGSAGKTYLTLRPVSQTVASVTTITFDHPTAATGWGFALGDVDADATTLGGTDAAGNPLTGADFGWQDAFNYCTVSPRPGSCGAGPFTDLPTWDEPSRTLRGQGPNTAGSSGWFRPTVAIKTLTVTVARITGSPIVQLWLAALAVPVTTTITGLTPESVVADPGVQVELQQTDHTPVTDPTGDPVVVTADDRGHVELPAVTDGDYLLHLVVPLDVTITGPTDVPITVDTATGGLVVPAGTFKVRAAVRSTPTPTSSSSSSAGGVGLANTGTIAGPALAGGLVLLLAGGGLLFAGRRRPTRH